jgi:hypothetical protein
VCWQEGAAAAAGRYKTDKPVTKNAMKPKTGFARPKNRGKQKQKTEAEGLLLNRQKARTCELAW